jgi:hypothetical protein
MLDDSEIEWLNNYHKQVHLSIYLSNTFIYLTSLSIYQVRQSLIGMMTEFYPDSVSYLENETKPIMR